MKITSIGRDILVGVLISAATYAVFVGVDALEWWHAWTRANEGWDTDEIPAALLGGLVGLVWFSFRRWRESAVWATTQKRNETFHRQLLEALETLPIGVVFYDRDHRMAFSNSQFRRFNPFGEGGRGEAWFGRRLARHRGTMDLRYQSCLDGVDLLVHEHRIPDGGILTIIEDVTERKQTEAALRQSEARLRAILDNSPASIHLKDTDGRLLVVNKEFERRNRVTAKDALGNTSYDLIPAESAARLRAEEAWVIENRMPRSFERPLDYPDGKTGIYLATKFPVIDDTGTLTGIGSISTDITAQKRTEEQARQLRDELAHVARFHAMGELAAGFAHEVNQPLAAITAYATGILKRLRCGEEDRDELVEVMERITEQSQRAGDIVWRIYRFVRKAPSDKQPMDVNKAIAAAVGMVGARAEAIGVVVEQDVARDLSWAMADPIQIQQVLINLFNNAIEAMEEGNGRGHITVTAREGEGAMIEVTVADTGCGISPEIRAQLFQPFFTTKAEGMGIGLLICQTIIEENGGTLTLTSEPGRGTVVTFTIPRAGNGLTSDGPVRDAVG